MTDDIVTRLRHTTDYDCEMQGEAADEIERLRKENEHLTLLSNLWEAEFNAAVDALTRKTVRGE